MTKGLLALIFLGTLAPALQAVEEVTAAAGYSFASIQQEGGARAIAMGSTYVGIDEGSAAILWNPAGLGTMRRAEIALNHNSGLVGSIQEIAVLGIPLSYGNGLGISLNYEDNGVFNGRDSVGNVTEDYSARAYGGSLGWGFGGPDNLFMGMTLKVDSQDLAGTASTAIAGDFGVLWKLFPALTLGATYTNLGPDVDNRQLAQGLRVGASSYIGKGTDYQWLLALSDESLTYGDNSIHFGVEHTLYKFLALRAGYGFNTPNPTDASLLGWTFGGGIIVHDLSLSYAFVPLGDVGNMQRVSLTYLFGEHVARPKHRLISMPPAAPAPAAAPVYRAAAAPVAAPVGRVEATTPAPAAPVNANEHYVVKKGDTLWDISGKEKVRDDSRQWPLLYKANSGKIDDPNVIEPGQKLDFKEHYSNAAISRAQDESDDTAAIIP